MQACACASLVSVESVSRASSTLALSTASQPSDGFVAEGLGGCIRPRVQSSLDAVRGEQPGAGGGLVVRIGHLV